jgi:Pentapeptide repeats (8 copies)
MWESVKRHGIIRWGVLGAGAVAIMVVLFWPVTDLIASHDVGATAGPKRPAALQAARDAARGRVLQVGAGLLAVGAFWFTARNFRLSREGQVTDRYTRAIDHLGSDKLNVRIGGIYALERIARDSARDHPTIMEVLAAFIREQPQSPTRRKGQVKDSEFSAPPDIQAAATVIGRRNITADHGPIDLSAARLNGASLNGLDFTRVNFFSADLSGADLSKAKLDQAELFGARLIGTRLLEATLVYADLGAADLDTADLVGADLTGARS